MRERWSGSKNGAPEGSGLPSPWQSVADQSGISVAASASFINSQASSAFPAPPGTDGGPLAALKLRSIVRKSVSTAGGSAN
jgi:hypothetical protein